MRFQIQSQAGRLAGWLVGQVLLVVVVAAMKKRLWEVVLA